MFVLLNLLLGLNGVYASFQCLDSTQDNSVQMVNPTTFNNVPYSASDTIGMRIGTYTFTGVTTVHPIGFVISDINVLEVTGGTFLLNLGGIDYYIGTVVLQVKADFGTTSYSCFWHGFMGGENKLVYNENCGTSSPSPSPTNSPTTANPTESPTTSPTTTFPTASPTSPICCEYDLCFDDTDGDGVADYIEGFTADTDGDGILDFEDEDDDGDDLPTSSEHGGYGFTPEGSGGKFFHLNPDDDGDGVLTIVEIGSDPNNPTDTDGDGVLDYLDIDDDGDGILTITEAGGLPANGYTDNTVSTCDATGTTVADSECVANNALTVP